jgi:hypothetical protein
VPAAAGLNGRLGVHGQDAVVGPQGLALIAALEQVEDHARPWRAGVGELIVRGKGRRHDRLPLPVDVGEALVAYLSYGRSPDRDTPARHLFLTCRAPRGPIRADLIGDVVERACTRAGLPRVGHIACAMPWPASYCAAAPV